MPINLENHEIRFGGGRIRISVKDECFAVISGTASRRNFVRGKLAKLGSVMQETIDIVKIKKDGEEYSTKVGTGNVSFVNKNGKVIGKVDCNAPAHASKLVALFYMYVGKGYIEDIESSFDPDPSKAPPRKAGATPRSSKKSPAHAVKKSSGSNKKHQKKEEKKDKKKTSSSVTSKLPAAAPKKVEDDEDSSDEDGSGFSDDE